MHVTSRQSILECFDPNFLCSSHARAQLEVGLEDQTYFTVMFIEYACPMLGRYEGSTRSFHLTSRDPTLDCLDITVSIGSRSWMFYGDIPHPELLYIYGNQY